MYCYIKSALSIKNILMINCVVGKALAKLVSVVILIAWTATLDFLILHTRC